MFTKIASFLTAATLLLLLSAGLSAKEAAPPPRVAANNKVALQKVVGRTATVHGKVKTTSVSKSGIHFVNFYSSELSIVCFRKNVAKFKNGGPAKEYKGREIEVTGKVERYKNKLQIKLLLPKQVKIVKADAKPTTNGKTPSLADVRVDGKGKTPSLADVRVGDPKKKFELKQIGKLTWRSPAGLTYKGKDSEGLTRVEHVLRHAADQPRRVGSHGVFDGGNDKALATVDEAWRIVKQKKIKPRDEGYSSAYTIPMGRRVGYLGGQNGARRKNPPLKRVFIVVRKNTTEVITAFPK